MQKRKPIDETAGRVGAMMRQARHVCHMPTDDAAALLYVMPEELVAYERGVKKIPAEVLEHFFVTGYKMMHVRVLEKRYRRHRDSVRKVKKRD
ncbi:hypothetical protein HDR61_01060 [bacterium]|nr:hypothetical protein [bacterium]